MHNIEKSAVMAGLLALFVLTVISLAVPEFGVLLLVLVLLGIAGVITAGAVLLWTTRYKPLTDEEINTYRKARGQRDVMSQ